MSVVILVIATSVVAVVVVVVAVPVSITIPAMVPVVIPVVPIVVVIVIVGRRIPVVVRCSAVLVVVRIPICPCLWRIGGVCYSLGGLCS